MQALKRWPRPETRIVDGLPEWLPRPEPSASSEPPTRSTLSGTPAPGPRSTDLKRRPLGFEFEGDASIVWLPVSDRESAGYRLGAGAGYRIAPTGVPLWIDLALEFSRFEGWRGNRMNLIDTSVFTAHALVHLPMVHFGAGLRLVTGAGGLDGPYRGKYSTRVDPAVFFTFGIGGHYEDATADSNSSGAG